ncbi:MAG: hypothetical protein HS132_12675 [Planctomycetia bacterium]|nr:hypothetical protein [Planctomycetia bacterium]
MWSNGGFAAPSFAEEAAPGLAPRGDEVKLESFFKSIEISGFIDTYYSYNYSRPSDQRGSAGGFVRDSAEGDWVDVRASDRRTIPLPLDNIEISVFKPSTEKTPLVWLYNKLW